MFLIAIQNAHGMLVVRFGSEADVRRAQPDVRSTPESGHQSDAPSCPLRAIRRHGIVLFDDLIGAGKQPGRYFEVEGLGGLQIDNKFVF